MLTALMLLMGFPSGPPADICATPNWAMPRAYMAACDVREAREQALETGKRTGAPIRRATTVSGNFVTELIWLDSFPVSGGDKAALVIIGAGGGIARDTGFIESGSPPAWKIPANSFGNVIPGSMVAVSMKDGSSDLAVPYLTRFTVSGAPNDGGVMHTDLTPPGSSNTK